MEEKEKAPKTEPIGAVYGNVGSLRFRCALKDDTIREMDYIQVLHPKDGWTLGMVDSVELQSDVSMEGALMEEKDRGTWKRVASITMIGRLDTNGALVRPLTPVHPSSPVYRAEEDLLKEVLGLRLSREEGAYVGKIMNTDVDVVLDVDSLAGKHISIIAKTGSGKSYTCGVLIEELQKHGIPMLVLDLHGEYSSLVSPNIDRDQYRRMKRFGVRPSGLGDTVREFTFSSEEPSADRPHPLGVDISGFKAEDLLDLMGIRNLGAGTSVLYNALNRAKEVLDDDYDLNDVLSIVEGDHNPARWNIAHGLQHLLSMPFFKAARTPLTEVISPGKVSVLELREVPLDVQQMGTAALIKRLYIARKDGVIPPFMLVVEEAHNFCPQSGPAVTSTIVRTVAAEGRKFGMGLVVVTQRPAKVDKNVLSQCGTQIIMKVTNPNDLKAVISSVEGLDPRMSDEIQRLPVSIGIVVGGNVSSPLLTEIRTRSTRHGGEGVPMRNGSSLG